MTSSPHGPRRTVALALLAAVGCSGAGLTATPPPARADPATGAISGTLGLGAGAVPPPGGSFGEMLAESPSGQRERPTLVSSAPVDPTGAYEITGLPPGSYLLTNFGPAAELWYPESSDPLHGQAVTVAAGETTVVGPMLDVTGTTIAGTVTGAGGRPLPGASPFVFARGPDGSIYEPASGTSETTHADGAYAISGIPAGTWTIGMNTAPRGYIPSAESVTTTGAGTTTVDLSLRRKYRTRIDALSVRRRRHALVVRARVSDRARLLVTVSLFFGAVGARPCRTLGEIPIRGGRLRTSLRLPVSASHDPSAAVVISIPATRTETGRTIRRRLVGIRRTHGR